MGESRYVAVVMAIQFAATFSAIRRSTLLFMTVFFGVLFFWTAFDMLDVDEDFVALVLGASLVLTAVGVDRTPHRVITPGLVPVRDDRRALRHLRPR